MAKQPINDYSEQFSAMFQNEVKESLKTTQKEESQPKIQVQTEKKSFEKPIFQKPKKYGKTFCLRIKSEYVVALDALASASNTSLNDIINEAIRLMLNNL